MTRSDRMLFHQIHPAKLLTDFGTSFASTWLLWEQHWALWALVAFVPSIVMTGLLLRFANLDALRRSWLGHYVAQHMSRAVVARRIVGQLVVWAAAAAHVPWLIPFGYFIVVWAWLDGLWATSPKLTC
jgi:hypothetical protein